MLFRIRAPGRRRDWRYARFMLAAMQTGVTGGPFGAPPIIKVSYGQRRLVASVISIHPLRMLTVCSLENKCHIQPLQRTTRSGTRLLTGTS